MKTWKLAFAVSLLASLMQSSQAAAIGYGDSTPRPMGMAGAYGALARGVESLYWNPANLALSGSPRVSVPFSVGVSLVGENNSISVSDYNKYNGTFIDTGDKEDILGKIDKSGMEFTEEVGVVLPLLDGACFPMPWGLRSAASFSLQQGAQGEIPKDMFDLLLFGNEFARDRLAAGKDPEYDIAEWDGSGWALGVLSWGFAKPWMPARLQPWFSEFTVGATAKFMGGAYGEVLRTDGGVTTQVSGAQIDAYAITREGGGTGFGLDLGVAGVTRDRKTTVSVALMNFLDQASWGSKFGVDARKDSFFVSGQDVNVLSFTGKEDVTEVFDNPRDAQGDVIFRQKIGSGSFSRSLPAMLRLGVARDVRSNLMVSGNYDQAFSSGFGISTTPRLAVGLEYRLVNWFPFRFGLAAGGRAGMSSAIGFAFGPFGKGGVRLCLLDTALANRGGFLPGVSKGAAISINFIRLGITAD